MSESSQRPLALILAGPDDVPGFWRSRLATLVEPVWWPRPLADLPADDPLRDRCAVLVATPRSLDAAALRGLPALRLVVATTTAVDYLDLEYCAAAGITVRGNGAYAGTSVAEHAFTLLLTSLRRMPAAMAAARGEPVVPEDPAGPAGTSGTAAAFELAGATAGVIGLGDIGGRIAAIARGFGMRVLFTGRTPRTVPGATWAAIDDLVREADAVFLSVPLTPETRHLVDASRLALMKPSAHLVSISPDEVIEHAALARALSRGDLGGAALDLVGDPAPYRGLPRLVLTRRWGIRTREARWKRAERWVTTVQEDLAAGLHLPRARS